MKAVVLGAALAAVLTTAACSDGGDGPDRDAGHATESRDLEQEAADAAIEASQDATLERERLGDLIRRDLCAGGALPPCGSLVDFVTVVDGDTLRLNGDLVRLVGIDAPEPGECGAPEARARLQKLIQASGFESGEALVAAPLRSRRGADFPDLDIYGRPLRELKYISERPAEGDELVPQPEVVWVGLELAREGHARWVDYSTANDMNRRDYLRATREYRQAADAAKAAGRGGWGTCGWK